MRLSILGEGAPVPSPRKRFALPGKGPHAPTACVASCLSLWPRLQMAVMARRRISEASPLNSEARDLVSASPASNNAADDAVTLSDHQDSFAGTVVGQAGYWLHLIRAVEAAGRRLHLQGRLPGSFYDSY